MKFRFLLILLIIGYTSQAQSTYTKWALEAGVGVYGASSSFAPGYSQSSISLPQFSVGARYMFNETIGVRTSLGYLSMNEGDGSLDFKTNYWRGSLEGMLDLSHLLRVWDRRSPFTVMVHAGGGLSRTDFENSNSADNMLHITGGVMPQYEISDRISLFADFSYFGHKSQASTWDGTTSGNNGNIWTASIGVVFNLQTSRIPWARRVRMR